LKPTRRELECNQRKKERVKVLDRFGFYEMNQENFQEAFREVVYTRVEVLEKMGYTDNIVGAFLLFLLRLRHFNTSYWQTWYLKKYGEYYAWKYYDRMGPE